MILHYPSETLALWQRQHEANSQFIVTDGNWPVHSFSVAGHPVAGHFKDFIAPYLNGRVLDIGCGPQPVPYYLDGYPIEDIVGLDPIESRHPFEFHCEYAEFIPFDSDLFDCAIFATSLDHLLSPLDALREAKRVLKDGGLILVWSTFFESADAYDPMNPPTRGADTYHAYRLTFKWFDEMCDSVDLIRVLSEQHNEPYSSTFWALRVVK